MARSYQPHPKWSQSMAIVESKTTMNYNFEQLLNYKLFIYST